MATITLNKCICTTISGPLGHCNMLLRGKPFNRSSVVPPPHYKTSHTLSKGQALTRTHGKRVKDRPERVVWDFGEHCYCDAYVIADILWVNHQVDHELWIKAVKRKTLSGYDLWIKEATQCAKNGWYLPDVPSISGGYTTDKIIPGLTWQPPANCVPQPGVTDPSVYPTYWPPWDYPLFSIVWQGIDPDVFLPLKIIQPVELRWFWDPDDRENYVNGFTTWTVPPTADEIPNPMWPAEPIRYCEIYILTEQGQTITYSSGTFGLFYLANLLQYAYPPFENQGKWE